MVTDLIISLHFSSASVFGHRSYHKFTFLFPLRFWSQILSCSGYCPERQCNKHGKLGKYHQLEIRFKDKKPCQQQQTGFCQLPNTRPIRSPVRPSHRASITAHRVANTCSSWSRNSGIIASLSARFSSVSTQAVSIPIAKWRSFSAAAINSLSVAWVQEADRVSALNNPVEVALWAF